MSFGRADVLHSAFGALSHVCKIGSFGRLDRFGERAIEKAINHRHIDQPTAVSDDFTLPGHSINNIELTPLELINSRRDAIRKAREAFLNYQGQYSSTTYATKLDLLSAYLLLYYYLYFLHPLLYTSLLSIFVYRSNFIPLF